jgi:hypothetical protein
MGWTKWKFTSIKRYRIAVKLKKKQEGSFYEYGVFKATTVKLTPTLWSNISMLSFFSTNECLNIMLILMSVIFFHILGLKASYEI